MENIRRALQRAKQLNPGLAGQNDYDTPLVPGVKFDANFGRDPAYKRGQERDHDRTQQIALDAGHLESNRIVAHDDTDYRSKAFDMLRTQVLQTMDRKNWKILGITSPSPGCGKTLTSINLALSIARQPEQPVLLVELDLQKPQIANYLGIKCRTGIVSVLDGRSKFSQRNGSSARRQFSRHSVAGRDFEIRFVRLDDVPCDEHSVAGSQEELSCPYCCRRSAADANER